MRTSHRIIGAIILLRATPETPYTPEDQALIQELADRAALTLAGAQLFQENRRQAEQLRRANEELEQRVMERTQQLAQANEKLHQLATHDPLTGIFNRRQFDISLANELGRAQRDQRWLSLLMLDIDYFKRYNDLYGHQAGDRCLQQVAQVIDQCFRRSADLVARYGGEEFAVILPELDPEQARERAERLVEKIAAQHIPHQGSDIAAWLTASVGVVTFRAGSHCTPEWAIARADEALYASKAAGRNRVTVSDMHGES